MKKIARTREEVPASFASRQTLRAKQSTCCAPESRTQLALYRGASTGRRARASRGAANEAAYSASSAYRSICARLFRAASRSPRATACSSQKRCEASHSPASLRTASSLLPRIGVVAAAPHSVAPRLRPGGLRDRPSHLRPRCVGPQCAVRARGLARSQCRHRHSARRLTQGEPTARTTNDPQREPSSCRTRAQSSASLRREPEHPASRCIEQSLIITGKWQATVTPGCQGRGTAPSGRGLDTSCAAPSWRR